MKAEPATGVLPGASPGNPAERLGALFDAHHDRLYRLARRLTPGADDALDLLQETFLKAARAAASIPAGAAGEEAWLVRVLVNIRRDQWRKAAVRQRCRRDLIHAAAADTDQEAILVARASVWHALDTLTPRRRAVVVMHELDGLSAAAIASLLGISALTVRWHLSMGRRDLARSLRAEIGDSHEYRQRHPAGRRSPSPRAAPDRGGAQPAASGGRRGGV